MNLPVDILANILSRVPIKTIIYCKCVCKRWRNLMLEPYFVDLHLSRSPEGLIIDQFVPAVLKVAQVHDTFDHYDIHIDPQMDLGLDGLKQSWLRLVGSINGLVCLWDFSKGTVIICNPITREYSTLLPEYYDKGTSYVTGSLGFGYVEGSNEYKIVHFYQDDFSSATSRYKSKCEIYMFGTGRWRSLGQVPFLVEETGVFVGGNLHWLTVNENEDELICTMNLEDEIFHLTAYAPEVGPGIDTTYTTSLGMLRGCLCICFSTDVELVIYVMKETWSKEVVVTGGDYIDLRYASISPLKVFEDGTILMLLSKEFFTYHPGTKTLQKLDIFRRELYDHFDAMVYVPSLIRLSSFVLENISIF